jgi:peptidoglycan hydrolase-like protein with peptidoglycan-binding domain
LRRGSTGPNVVVLQAALNRIAQSYPAIPKIPAADGIFGPRTEATVRKFQQVFGLTEDGIVGRATWYAIVRLYTAVTRLAELRSQGQRFYNIEWAPPGGLQIGDTGEKVRHLQYMLSVLSAYISSIPPVTIDGIYGSATRAAVLAAQRRFRLPETGVTDAATWNEIYNQYAGIENTVLRNRESFPNGNRGGNGPTNRTSTMTQFPGTDLRIGAQDPIRQEVVR